jgi:hypothetical protein
MQTMTWVRRSLRTAVAATALLGTASSAALAQITAPQAQEPAKPAEPNLSLFDNRLKPSPKQKSFMDSWLSGVEMKCIGCGLFDPNAVHPEPANANAPWLLQGQLRRQTPIGAVSLGFVGARNYALPLFTATPIGGNVDARMLTSSGTSVFAPVSQWSLTASLEKTLLKRANGASLGITADAFFPVATNSVTAGDPRFGGLTSPTFRVGLVLRW